MDKPQTQPPTALFVQLLSRHQAALAAFIGSLVPTRADADDILQETSLALWRKWSEFDTNRDFFRWACGIAHIQVLRHRRKSATDRLWFDAELLDLLAEQMLESHDLFELRRDALDFCLQRLSPGERSVVELRYQQDMTADKVAEKCGTTVRTVHRTMARVRRLLQHCITATVRQWHGTAS